jgi:hypothetical protein
MATAMSEVDVWMAQARGRARTSSRRVWAATAVMALVWLIATPPAGSRTAVAVQTAPPGFAARMGYEPVLVVLADGTRRWAKPDGTCSTLWGGAPFDFTPVCRTHDLSYDLLRHAATVGTPDPPDARRAADARFASDLHNHCAATVSGPARPGCHALARLYHAAARLNSWRQRDGPPVDEPWVRWLRGAALVVVVAHAAPRAVARDASAAAARTRALATLRR